MIGSMVRNFYCKGYKCCFKNIQNPNKILCRIEYSGLGSSIEIWKLKCNIEIGGHTNRCDKNNKKKKGYSYRERIREIRINYFTRKKNERGSN